MRRDDDATGSLCFIHRFPGIGVSLMLLVLNIIDYR